MSFLVKRAHLSLGIEGLFTANIIYFIYADIILVVK